MKASGYELREFCRLTRIGRSRVMRMVQHGYMHAMLVEGVITIVPYTAEATSLDGINIPNTSLPDVSGL